MKKLLIVLTGGTFGSSTTESGTLATQTTDVAALQTDMLSVISSACEDTSVTFIQPFNKLSEHLTSRDWENLIYAIETNLAIAIDNGAPFDGVLVIHGTDTMVYTANALAFHKSNLLNNVPIVFTGSALPWDAEKSDAPGRLYDAVSQLEQLSAPVPYRRTGVYIAWDARWSIPFATKVAWGQKTMLQGHYGINKPQNHQAVEHPRDWLPIFGKTEASLIREVPGQCYPVPAESTRAVLIQLYGSGTGSLELVAYAKKLHEEGILVFYIPQHINEEGKPELTMVYDGSDKLLLYGTPLNLWPETAWVKLLYALGQPKLDVVTFMKTSIIGEFPEAA